MSELKNSQKVYDAKPPMPAECIPTKSNSLKFHFLLLLPLVLLTLSSTALRGETSDEQHDLAAQAKEKLAVIVQRDEDATIDSDTLQSLVEFEFSSNWQGDFLERKNLEALHKEQELSIALAAPSAGLKLGAILHVDYLVLVTVKKDQVVCIVNRFPEATVVSETVYQDQLSEESLSQRISVYSLKSIKENKLDKTKMHVSIGSFTYKDPYRKYLKVSDTIHNNLRERLSKQPRVMTTERLFPTHLLKEYNLARSGLSNSLNAHLSAPPADILVFGKFTPQEIQKLDSDETILDFEVTFASPTELFTSTVESFSISSKDLNSACLKIEETLAGIIKKTEQHLNHRTQRNYNDTEFKTFKQQAQELIPSVRSTIQENTRYSPESTTIRHEFESALRAIENALMFNGNDSELMVEAGLLLARIAEEVVKSRKLYYEKDDPAYREEYLRAKAISEAGLDYIEKAYLLNANEATRKAYASRGSLSERHMHPKRISKMMRHIVDSGPNGGWKDYQISNAVSKLSRLSDSIDEKFQIFLNFACNQELGYEPKLQSIVSLFGTVSSFVNKHRDDPNVTMKAVSFAEALKNDNSATIKALGYLLHSMIFRVVDKNDEASIEQFCKVVDLIPEIHEKYGRSYSLSTFPTVIFDSFRHQLSKKNFTESAFVASQKYAATQMKIKNYWDPGLKQCIRSILPELDQRGEYQKGYDLAKTALLNIHNGGTYGDANIVYWKNKFASKLASYSRTEVSDFDRIDMSGASRANGRMRIYRLIYAFNQIWGINSHLYINGSHGQAFKLSPDSTEVTFLNKVTGMVSGIDCSSEHVGVSTIDSGVYFLDEAGKTTTTFTIDNSLLPSNEVRFICSDGETFHLGISGKERLSYQIVHELDPKQGTLKNTQNRISNLYPIRWFQGSLAIQRFEHRTHTSCDVHLEFRRRKNTNIVTNHLSDSLMTFEGAELGRLYDFILWKGLLVFADESGLYASKLKSNELQCILSEEDLNIYSLCAVENLLFVGTSNGLLRIDYDTFKKILK